MNASPVEIVSAILRPKPKVKLYPGDCLDVLSDMDESCVHMVLTDPPYFLDGLDNDWKKR